MKKLLKHNLLYVLMNQGLLSVSSALIIIILAKFTDLITFGEVRYLIAVLSIFAFWSLPGLSLIINHEASIMTRKNLLGLVQTQLKWGLWASMTAFLAATFYMIQGQRELAQAFIIGGIVAPVANLYLVPGLILAGVQRFKQKTIVDAFIMFAVVGGITVGATSFESIPYIIASYLGVQAVATALALLFVMSILPKGESRVQSRTSDIAHGTELTFLQMPFSLLPALEKAIIFMILGPAALGIFVIAVLPIEHFKSAFRNLMQFYMLPHLIERNVQVLLHWVATGALILTLGIVALVVFILYGMPVLFDNFGEAKHFSLLLVLAALPLPIHILTISWIAKRQMENLRFYAVLATVTNIVFIGTSAALFGLMGATIAKIMYEVVLTGGLLRLDRTQARGAE